MRRVLSLVLFLLVSVPAIPGDPGAWFRKLDRNKDGYLDRKELAGMRRHLTVFDQADENKDGKLDPAEFIQAEVLVSEMRRGGAKPIPAASEPIRKEPAG
ncbi:MAG TPA: EF-hand domain-containing protein [Burkholderiales bacterium]|jgi:hypothetical protein|nr:EF-hand domain-containing protein [Burkholderiales bacterium]